MFETYDLSFEELIGQINRNNRLIAAGAIESGAGRIVLKVPGLIEDGADVIALPVKMRGDTVVTFGDVATIRRTSEGPTGFALIDGHPALALEIERRSGLSPLEAALRTGAQRLRPVVLTSVTTALGLLPMVIGVNVNFFPREIVYGAPSTQWWTELYSAIAGGRVIATALTLIVTPAMLMPGEKRARQALPAGPVVRDDPFAA